MRSQPQSTPGDLKGRTKAGLGRLGGGGGVASEVHSRSPGQRRSGRTGLLAALAPGGHRLPPKGRRRNQMGGFKRWRRRSRGGRLLPASVAVCAGRAEAVRRPPPRMPPSALAAAVPRP